jgi:hypothetical protein
MLLEYVHISMMQTEENYNDVLVKQKNIIIKPLKHHVDSTLKFQNHLVDILIPKRKKKSNTILIDTFILYCFVFCRMACVRFNHFVQFDSIKVQTLSD